MPKSKHGFALQLLLVILAVIKITSIEACSINQFTRVTVNGTKCIDCPKCPAGYGLQIQCGSRIQENDPIKCEPCTKGVNYSSENDYEQCQPCGDCSNDQVMEQCTTQSNTKCHRKCESKDKYYEETTDDCQMCSWCCGDKDDKVAKECSEKGMPSQQSCTWHRKKICTQPTTTTSSTAIPTVIQTTQASTVKSIHSQSQKKVDDHTHLDSNSVTAIIVVAIAIVVIVGLCMLRCYCKKRNQRQCNNYRERIEMACVRCHPSPQISYVINESINEHSTIEESSPQSQPLIVQLPDDQLSLFPSHQEESSQYAAELQLIPAITQDNDQTTGADIELFEWLEKHHEVEEVICDMLDCQESYADVARHFEMPETKIKKLLGIKSNNPTKDVLEYIKCSCNPDLLISEFLDCTDKINRKDVSKKLKEALAQA